MTAVLSPPAALPVLTDAAASRFLRESTEVGSTEWLRRVRAWVRDQKR